MQTKGSQHYIHLMDILYESCHHDTFWLTNGTHVEERPIQTPMDLFINIF